MKLIIRFIVHLIAICLFIGGLTAHAETKTARSDINVDALLDAYIKTWAMPDPTARRVALEKIWVKKGVHESPFSHSLGIEAINTEIDGFLKMFPNAVVRLSDIKRTNNKLVCKFVLQNEKGEPLMTGVDYFELNNEGKIIKVIGFVEERQATP